MAPRPSDVRAIEALLLAEHPDVTELAKQVIETVDALRADRVGYVVVSAVPGAAWARGPYLTVHQAEKAVGKGVGVVDGGRTGVLALHPAIAAIPPEPGRNCPTCGHPREAHNFPRSRQKGCVVGLPPSDPSKRPMPGTPARCDCEGDGR